ncbi:MAG: bactofilin family protein [Gammaproteobacteria bacterium]
MDTLIGKGATIRGEIEFAGGLHVDGFIKGDIKGGDDTTLLSVSDEGCIEGTVSVPHVILNGTVRGDVRASERIELGETARVFGNVYYNLIQMAIGAEVNGKLIHAPAAGPPLLEKPAADRAAERTVDTWETTS